MKSMENKTLCSCLGVSIVAVGLAVALPSTSARANHDDWEDRWEDYQEQLHEEREEARERWREWREDEHKHWRGRRDYGPRDYDYYGPPTRYRAYRYPGRYYYDYRSVPEYRSYYREPRRYYTRYPRYRYYGTPNVGYSEFGRERSVRVGPFHVYWDRD